MTDRKARVLWTSNIDLPAATASLGLKSQPFGGWLSLMTERLAQTGRFHIGVAMRSESAEFAHVEVGGIDYYALPRTRTDRFDVAQSDCARVLRDFSPDILHVEGGEMRHALRFLETWQGPRLLSMQGVVNGYAPYELGRLPILRMLSPARPRIMATATALLAQERFRFRPRLAFERATMQAATDIMGRTLWDRAQAHALAPHARYHHGGRILRSGFYGTSWKGATCEKHSLFVGNGAAPRKGAHVALAALAILKRSFPDVHLYIAGEDPDTLSKRSLKRWVGYPVYLRHLIDTLDLEDNVTFTGILNETKMIERMASSHVAVMSSLIENSPNTLGEAMILGVPVVSAFAGGAPSMARDEREALFYRPDDPAMLAFQVRRIFQDEALARSLSEKARLRAGETHDPDRNLAALISVYDQILSRGSR
ncbi:glycosyltransferase family 4 protein [Maritimibacter dapengensis]|uniref:Glycosyltransferase n=1 Tax=Maritimibacter dapengensis TaxID=2836868 RepID=A0ABS6T028_9RHOB|nr:glycosyltransferase [Maritimibacter dapengensis]MBV7377956.1 glycosyltransferase [Maritimibacter dapengensis]